MAPHVQFQAGVELQGCSRCRTGKQSGKGARGQPSCRCGCGCRRRWRRSRLRRALMNGRFLPKPRYCTSGSTPAPASGSCASVTLDGALLDELAAFSSATSRSPSLPARSASARSLAMRRLMPSTAAANSALVLGHDLPSCTCPIPAASRLWSIPEYPVDASGVVPEGHHMRGDRPTYVAALGRSAGHSLACPCPRVVQATPTSETGP